MLSVKRILFPYDFSEQGALAIPFVRAMAECFRSQVTLLSVVPPVWTAPPIGMAPLVASAAPATEHELDARLHQIRDKELAGVPANARVLLGDPAQKIVEFAALNSADLIMMPTHGCGLFRSLLLGSVTSKVLHDAKCPIWTATHAEEQHAPSKPRRILCAVDDNPATVELLRWANEFSENVGAKLTVLHVVPPISDWLALPSERELQEQVRDVARTNVERLRSSAQVTVPVRIAVGKIAETVAEGARQDNADLILIGRGLLPQSLGRLRTNIYGVIQKAPCPVLSV